MLTSFTLKKLPFNNRLALSFCNWKTQNLFIIEKALISFLNGSLISIRIAGVHPKVKFVQ